MAPAFTEIICALNAEDALVGRSFSCNYPESVRALPVCGDFAIPNPEALATVGAEVVISDTFQDPSIKELLGQLGIKTVMMPLNSFDDYRHALNYLGELLNRRQEAEALLAAIPDAEALEAGENPAKVVLLFWFDPPMSCGKRSFMNDYLRLANGVNVLENVDEGYFYPSIEAIAAAAPEVVIFPTTEGMTAKEVKNSLKAAAPNAKILEFDRPDLLCRMSPRWPETVKKLKAMLGD